MDYEKRTNIDYKEIAKKIFYPGYGLYKALQKPKEKRNLLWTIGFGAQALFLGAKIAITPFYINQGIKTNDWNFVNYVKEKIVKIENKNKSAKNLEKTIYFDSKLE